MRALDYTEPITGLAYRVLLPDSAPDAHAHMGIRLGPPDLAPLGLPPATAARLHQELWNRGLITRADVERRPEEVRAALLAACKADALAVIELYG